MSIKCLEEKRLDSTNEVLEHYIYQKRHPRHSLLAL